MKIDCVKSKKIYQLTNELEDTAIQLGNRQKREGHEDSDLQIASLINQLIYLSQELQDSIWESQETP
ncbi:hypothetical protein [Brumicola pallidula]|uniref:Uncharacterized protein n=1 Tax=Brumicola pallidula DSM 14239 = ACAM 615 TaxID=1121922 RepID=K6ZG09_9ALTE|nr:hypothetical protein [Glaciecola pallidula]GAC27868.1 hypothetical protein GPAL_0989 [Glaciecola pallidula DSM 14239 = ACAM 615]